MIRHLFILLIGASASAAPLVLSVDRLYRDDPARLMAAGEVLLTELHCVNCHRVDERLRDRIPTVPGPNLQDAGPRLRGEFLRRWLANPHVTVPGSRMPDLLANLPAATRTANASALAGFIESLAGPASEEELPADAANGRSLFHSVGCVACHAPRADFTETAAGEKVDAADVKTVSVSLDHVSAKYTSAGLAGFLLDPHASRPAGRMPAQNLSASEAADIGAYLTGGHSARTIQGVPATNADIAQGRELFAAAGCAACHGVTLKGETIGSALKAPVLYALDGKTGGCLADSPARSLPRYQLDRFQRTALVAALGNLGSPAPPNPEDKIRRRLVALNCLACHQRDGLGGPDAARLKYFVSSGADLGDEGRVPPTLTGVGRKLREDALAKTIRGAFPVRPYMTTRMPAFPEHDAAFLAGVLAAADADSDELPTPRDGEENQVGRNMWGRALVGTTGLNCVTCHQVRGHKSLGIPAVDLAHSAKRLRPEWFRDYLVDPAKFRPGTRMPAFWPDGKPLAKGNGSSTSRQIDSIWVYLNEIDQSRLPEGMERTGNFLLTPKDRPLVFRTFMEAAGMHAIAVGFPEQVHAAFDGQTLRWTTAWTGKFLDAESTWDDRFTPLAVPAGENVVSIQPLPPQHGDLVPAFTGYTARRDYAPELRYRLGDVQIEDRMEPARSGSAGRLTRVIGKVGNGGPIWFEVANGKAIRQPAAGVWVVDGKLTVGLISSRGAPDGSKNIASRIVISKAGSHLQFRLLDSPVRSQTHSLSVYYDW